VKAKNEIAESKWSNTESTKVDWAPSAPTGLKVNLVTGHEAALLWNKHSESDISGYHIFINDTDSGSSGPFSRINTITGTDTQYVVTNLAEETTYYFTISAFDNSKSNSTFSNSAGATTLDVTAPAAPEGLTAKPISNYEILLSWDANTEPDLKGYIIYMNDTGSGKTGKFHVVHTIFGDDTSYQVRGLSEQINYHFRLAAFDEVPNNSTLSKVASAETPDLIPPGPPANLTVRDPKHDSLIVTWSKNPEPDVKGYFLYRSGSLYGSYKIVDTELIYKNNYIDEDLEEETTYYYKLKAVDDAGLESPFSDPASGTTILAPAPPEINNSQFDISINEDTYDDTSINLYHWFKDVNNDPLDFSCFGNDFITVTIYPENGTVALKPMPNWNGEEIITFTADDGHFKEVSDTVTVTVTPVNDAPFGLVITNPENDYKIMEKTELDFTATCRDYDLIYGDQLFYSWSSDIDGRFGEGENLVGITLSPGSHVITLEVADSRGGSTSGSINITVQRTSKGGLSEDKGAMGLIAAALIIAAIIVIVIIFFIMKLRRRNEDTVKEEVKRVQVLPPAPPGLGQPAMQRPQVQYPGLPPMHGPPATLPAPQPVLPPEPTPIIEQTPEMLKTPAEDEQQSQ
jgi:fibronectin type 3 domain-containing protein